MNPFTFDSEDNISNCDHFARFKQLAEHYLFKQLVDHYAYDIMDEPLSLFHDCTIGQFPRILKIFGNELVHSNRIS